MKQEIEAFLYKEARLADENRYDEWTALWTDDAIYWVPANLDDYDPREHISLIYDDRERIRDGRAGLKSGAAGPREPRPGVQRVVPNIDIDPPAAKGETPTSSISGLGDLRRGREPVFFPRQIHRLRPTPQGLRLA